MVRFGALDLRVTFIRSELFTEVESREEDEQSKDNEVED